MQAVINFFINQPTDVYTTLLAYLGGSTAVATVLQVIKHKFSFAEAKGLVTFMLALLSFVAAFADYLVQATSQNPTVLGQHTAIIAGVAVFVHRFAVSPIYGKVVNGIGGVLKDAAAYRSAVATSPENSETFQV